MHLTKKEEFQSSPECNDLHELSLNAQPDNVSDLQTYADETKGFISPESSLLFQYSFVFFHQEYEKLYALDLIPYTNAWRNKTATAQDEPFQTILVPTCSLLLDVYKKIHSNGTITPQAMTFLAHLDVATLTYHISQVKLTKANLMQDCLQYSEKYCTYIPVPPQFQSISGDRLNDETITCIGRFVNKPLQYFLKQPTRKIVKHTSGKVIGISYEASQVDKYFEIPTFTHVAFSQTNNCQAKLTENVELNSKDLMISESFLTPFTKCPTDYTHVFQEWMRMVRDQYIRPNPTIIYYRTTKRSASLQENKALFTLYYDEELNERGEYKFQEKQFVVVQAFESNLLVRIQKWIRFSNHIRSALEYIFRRDSDNKMYTIPDSVFDDTTRMEFEIKRLKRELTTSALIENSSMKRLSDYKKACLILT